MNRKSKWSFALMVVILGITHPFQFAYAQDSDQLLTKIEVCFSGWECFDAQAIYFGSFQSGTTNVGGGGGAGKVSMDDIALTRKPDKYSPLLFLNNASGRHIQKAKIKIGMFTQQGFLLNSMLMAISDFLISSYRLDANNSEYPVETIAINFAKIEIVVKDSIGKVVGEAGWNLKENKEE